jgi:hypothetical protein
LTLKEFAYRTSLSVIAKSSLNFKNMIDSVFNSNFVDLESDFSIEKLMSSKPVKEKKSTQMQNLQKQNIIRVAIVDDKAYFVHENTFYTASLVKGEVDRSSASPINAIDMSKKEMNLLLSILDNMN